MRIKIWTTRRLTVDGERKRFVVPFRHPYEDGEMVGNEPVVQIWANEMVCNSNSTENMSLIYDEKAFFNSKNVRNSTEESTRLKKTLFQAVVSEKYPEISGAKFDKKVLELEAKWGKDSFEIAFRTPSPNKLHLFIDFLIILVTPRP